MLGASQKAWLIDRMTKSDAEFFFVVSQVTFMIPHVGGTPTTGASEMNAGAAPTHDEAWPGFANEREELIRFWDSLGKPVLVLTGDVHNSFSVKVTDRIWELASGPHNWRNHRADAQGNPPPNGTFDYAGRTCDIRWSSYFLPDVPALLVRQPIYTVVQVNNVFNNPLNADKRAGWRTRIPRLLCSFMTVSPGPVVRGVDRRRQVALGQHAPLDLQDPHAAR